MAKRTIEDLERENERLRASLAAARLAPPKAEPPSWGAPGHADTHYYASAAAVEDFPDDMDMPDEGSSPVHCYRTLSDFHELDCRERLNVASYNNVHLEDEERKAANLGMTVDLADRAAYPQAVKVHNAVLSMIAKLWNCPKPADFDERGAFAGAGTVGGTEACVLAGLCLKLRWRQWYAKKHGLTQEQVRGVCPNLVLSTCYHEAWEKLFRYMDVQPRFVAPSKDTFALTADDVRHRIDERTIGVVCILGNHYGGQYDPVWDVDAMLAALNEERGWQVGIHVDASLGGFVAPFQDGMPAWDFRLPRVLSISASGHKFGESVCGTGWVVWRQRQGLSDLVAASVPCPGGQTDSFSLNSSRPASGVFVQYYKFRRLGRTGYKSLCDNRMANARYVRDFLKSVKHSDGRPKFVVLNALDGEFTLPVVSAYFNPKLDLPYDAIDLQNMMRRYHWNVPGYEMSFRDLENEETKPLFRDALADQTMFRVVIKTNVTRAMLQHLVESFKLCLADLEGLGPGFESMHARKRHRTSSKATRRRPSSGRATARPRPTGWAPQRSARATAVQ